MITPSFFPVEDLFAVLVDEDFSPAAVRGLTAFAVVTAACSCAGLVAALTIIALDDSLVGTFLPSAQILNFGGGTTDPHGWPEKNINPSIRNAAEWRHILRLRAT
jgi:hypothetical protein